MLGKSGWLAGLLAACVLIWSPGGASADERRDGHGARHHKHYGHDGYRQHYEYRRHHGHRSYGHRHRDSGRGARKYVYDDGNCRYTFKSGKHGTKETVRCRDGARHRPRHRPWHGAQLGERYADRTAWSGTYAPWPRVAQVLEHAPDGQAIVWNEPRNRARVEIAPTATYRANDGRYCREYQGTATLGGQTRQVYGQACRQPDGAWEIAR